MTAKGTRLMGRNKTNLNAEQKYTIWGTKIYELLDKIMTVKGTRLA
jgi:hypothetical protein